MYRLKKALERVARVGARMPKLVVDETFIVDMCEAFLEDFHDVDVKALDPFGKGDEIKYLRAVGIVLLGWEGGLRCVEARQLTACCWRRRADSDFDLHVKLAKNNRTMKYSVNTVVNDVRPFKFSYSCTAFMREFWLPFYRQCGLGVSESCSHLSFPHSFCRSCSMLFPSFGKGRTSSTTDRASGKMRGAISKRKFGRKPLSGSAIGDAVKLWAVRIGRDKRNYSAISFRRGSVSVARADSQVDRELAQQHLRHSSAQSQDFYVERCRSDRRAVGLAHRRAVEAASKEVCGRRVRFDV